MVRVNQEHVEGWELREEVNRHIPVPHADLRHTQRSVIAQHFLLLPNQFNQAFFTRLSEVRPPLPAKLACNLLGACLAKRLTDPRVDKVLPEILPPRVQVPTVSKR